VHQVSPTQAQAARSAGTHEAMPADQRILRATIHALSQMDPAALTIQQICRAANVSAPTLYYHFGNKDGLIAAGIERLVSDWLDLLDQQVSREGSLDDTLDQAVLGWEAMIQAPSRPLVVFVWVTLLAAANSQQSRDALIRARDRSHEMVRQALVAHLPSDTLADSIATLVIDAVIAAALEFQLDGDETGLRRRLNSLVQVVRMAATRT
jgi:AcrR family transcriptional regulator